MTVTGIAIRTKEPIMQAHNIVDIKSKLRSECIIDGIKVIVIQRIPTGVFISTEKELDIKQVFRMIDSLS